MHEIGLDNTRKFQLHQDHVDQGSHRGSAGLDDEVAALPVQRVSLGIELSQSRQGITHLKERPLGVMS
jgi:hypothetical protein